MESELAKMVEQYLRDQLELGHMKVVEAVQIHNLLVGCSNGLAPYLMGLVEFLIARGVKNPGRNHLDFTHLGQYRDYLETYCGIFRTREALAVIRPFWQWCADNQYFGQLHPPRLVVHEHPSAMKVSTRISGEFY